MIEEQPPPILRERDAHESAPHAPLLQAVDLHKHFGGNRAVDGVSLEVHRHQILGLVGPNGAGKSTIGALLAGSLTADGGRVYLDGERIDGLPPWHRARVGLLRTFQLSSEFGQLTVLENLLVGGALRDYAKLRLALVSRRRWKGIEDAEVTRARKLLEQFQLSSYESERTNRLSGGQRRLVEIMRALMGHPKLLLLDEPMSGLNEIMIGEVTEHLVRLRGEGLGMVLIEHNVDVVEGIADRVCALSEGRVLAEGTPAEVMSNELVMDVYLRG